jgi:hypothetical protein
VGSRCGVVGKGSSFLVILLGTTGGFVRFSFAVMVEPRDEWVRQLDSHTYLAPATL